MGSLQNKSIKIIWPWIHAFGFFALFAMQMTQYYYWNFYAAFFPNRYAAFAAAFIMLYYVIKRFKDGRGVKILTLYALWVLLTRIISGCFFNEDDLLFSTGMFVCVLSLALAYQFDVKKRQALLNVLTIVFIGIITFVSAIGVYAALIQKPVDIDFFGKTLNAADFRYQEGVLRLRIADAHPNISACWVFLCIFLLVNRFFSSGNIIIKLLVVLAIITDYLAMALTNCRTIYMCFAICAGMLAALLVLNRHNYVKTSSKILVLVLSIAVVSPLAYKSVDISLKGINYISMRIAAESEITDGEGIAGEDDTLYENSRGTIWDDTSTLKPRIIIWKSALETVKQEPLRLVIGSSKEKLTDISNELNVLPGFEIVHYHNMFLNILMLTGIPGFIIAIVFLYVLIKKMIILFFSKDTDASLAEKTLVLPLTGYILYGATLEVLLFTEADIRTFAFFLIAGVLLADCRDLRTGEKE